MILFYSGTPGSGKSLHTAEVLYWWIKAGKPAIGNININLDMIPTKKEKRYTYQRNDQLTPDFLISYAKDFAKGRSVKEDSLLLVIDECQLMFNARDWNAKGRADWLEFFTLHRHLGYRIILIAQFDRMIDRQVRSLIEYEYIHRKVSNFGIYGKIISMFSLGNLFVSVKIWYPMKEKLVLNSSEQSAFITVCMIRMHYLETMRARLRMGARGPPPMTWGHRPRQMHRNHADENGDIRPATCL